MTAKHVLRLGIACLALLYALMILLAPLDPRLLRALWFLPGVGVFGATIANTSGTGGGVVFVPVFNALRALGVMALDPAQVTAVSFCIQCFGMTSGALRWGTALHRGEPSPGAGPRDVWRIVLLVLAVSLPTMLATQRLAHIAPHTVLLAFKAFSIVLGIVLIVTTWTVNRTRSEQTRLAALDAVVLVILAVPGGFLTALFSVAIGEFVALYLFIRHYPLTTCIASAVIISSASVLTGAIHHIAIHEVCWEVVALAAPGAMLGGYIAQPIALWLGARSLKTIDGAWIILSSAYLIWVNA